ncbi:MAG: hypothetical protein ABIQ88_00060 [Chitinophagaceae bacterium]
MTIQEKTEKLYQSFLNAWDNYQRIEKDYAKSTGFNELLSSPQLKTAYQKWQTAVSDYYDFARSIEHKSIYDQHTGN